MSLRRTRLAYIFWHYLQVFRLGMEGFLIMKHGMKGRSLVRDNDTESRKLGRISSRRSSPIF